MKRLIYILSALALLSCDKEGSTVHRSEIMQFSVLTPELVSTKAEVTENGLVAAGDHVYVYGMSSDGSSSIPVFASPGTAKLQYNAVTDTWKPIQIEYETSPGNNEIVEKYVDKTWDSEGKLYYQFYAYAYSGNADLNTDLMISTDVAGRQFTVVQPASATWSAPQSAGGVSDGSGTVDYLLSYLVNVPPSPSKNYPLVHLQLEHAMAKVEVDVQLARAMLNKIKNVSVEIQGIRRGATMLCLQPKFDTDPGSNTWLVTMNEGLSRASYKVTDIACAENNLGEGANLISTDMSFIAVPVSRSEMDGYKLVLTYYNNGDDTSGNPTYRYEFALKDYSSNGWMSGHRVRYVLTVDNSIHLMGSIVDYQDVDYMDGVMLPDIQ